MKHTLIDKPRYASRLLDYTVRMMMNLGGRAGRILGLELSKDNNWQYRYKCTNRYYEVFEDGNAKELTMDEYLQRKNERAKQ